MTHLQVDKVAAGRQLESTILVERIAPADLLKRFNGQSWTQGLPHKPALKVTLGPSADELMNTADWHWYEFTFIALVGADEKDAVEITLHVYALTPPQDAWTEEELVSTLIAIIEGMRGLPVKDPRPAVDLLQ